MPVAAGNLGSCFEVHSLERKRRVELFHNECRKFIFPACLASTELGCFCHSEWISCRLLWLSVGAVAVVGILLVYMWVTDLLIRWRWIDLHRTTEHNAPSIQEWWKHISWESVIDWSFLCKGTRKRWKIELLAKIFRGSSCSVGLSKLGAISVPKEERELFN